MKKLLLLLCVCSLPLHAKFTDDELDKLLDNPLSTVDMLQEKAETFKEEKGYNFDPEDLNLIGALAKREYERLVSLKPVTMEELKQFTPDAEGHVKPEDLLRAHRYEGIAKILHRKLREVYGNKILPHPVRVINNVGGIFATMEIYNCSTREYLAGFGTMLEQTGYSGRYPYMKVWDIMVDGEMVSHGIEKNTSLPVTYGPGDVSLLKKKERRIYTMTPGAMMIDYGRGFIVPAFNQGVILPYKGNADWPSFKEQIWQCAKSFLNRN